MKIKQWRNFQATVEDLIILSFEFRARCKHLFATYNNVHLEHDMELPSFIKNSGQVACSEVFTCHLHWWDFAVFARMSFVLPQ